MKKAVDVLVGIFVCLRQTKTICLVAAVLCLSGFCGTAQGAVPQAVWKIYSTDIVAYIDGMAIPSYNLEGRTAVIVEDLAQYGFEVSRDHDGYPFDEVIFVHTMALPETKPDYNPVKPEKTGVMQGKAYKTDIRVRVNGKWIDAYSIDGRTAVLFDDLADTNAPWDRERDGNIHFSQGGYSRICMRTTWDADKRATTLECIRPGDYVDTNFGVVQIQSDALIMLDYNYGTYLVIDSSEITDIPEYIYYDSISRGEMSEYLFKSISIGKDIYYDIETFLDTLGITYAYHDKTLDIYSDSIKDKVGVGERIYNEWLDSNVFLPLDIDIAVDGEVKISSEDHAVAYEYSGRVVVSPDLFSEAVGRRIYRGKYDLPDECTEKVGDILTSHVLVYINDMVVPSYISDKGAGYLPVSALSGYGFGVGLSGNDCAITSPEKLPDEPPIPDGIKPQTYWLGAAGSQLYEIYNGIYNVTLDGMHIDNVYVWSADTRNTPCVLINDLVKIGGYRKDAAIPGEIKIYTQK